MISARAIYREILESDETYRLFCSVAAKGEAQGGWVREYAEIATYRDVSLGVMLSFGIRVIYAIERAWTWRRMTAIHPPARPGALAPRARAHKVTMA